MRCHICDTLLSDTEIEFEEDHGNYAPCNTCKQAATLGEKPYRHGSTLDSLLDELYGDVELLEDSEEDGV